MDPAAPVCIECYHLVKHPFDQILKFLFVQKTQIQIFLKIIPEAYRAAFQWSVADPKSYWPRFSGVPQRQVCSHSPRHG